MTPGRSPISPPGLAGLALAALLLAGGGPVIGQQSTAVVYVPPDLGAPPTRTLAAVRGLGAAAVSQVLASEQTGLTRAAQPTLFWYLGGPTELPVVLTLIDEAAVEPLLEVALGTVAEPGIHAVDLAAYDVRLEPGRLYQWSIAQVIDPEQRSADVVTSGTLERRAPDAELAAVLDGGDPAARLTALAQHGYWYDLLAELEAQIGAAGGDAGGAACAARRPARPGRARRHRRGRRAGAAGSVERGGELEVQREVLQVVVVGRVDVPERQAEVEPRAEPRG